MKNLLVALVPLLVGLNGILAGRPSAREATCEDCVLVVAELTVQMTTHDKAITQFLHDGFCVVEGLENQECRMIAGHYPDMLDVIVTHHVDPLNVCMHEGPNPPCAKGSSSGHFRDILTRTMTCEECNHYIGGINNHLTGPENIARFVTELQGHQYCGRPDNELGAECGEIVEQYFPEMHTEVMENFFHPHRYCVYIELCDAGTTHAPTVPSHTPTESSHTPTGPVHTPTPSP